VFNYSVNLLQKDRHVNFNYSSVHLACFTINLFVILHFVADLDVKMLAKFYILHIQVVV